MKLEPTALEAFVGAYPLTPQFIVTISREENRLYLQATGQPKFRLFASAEREFYLRVVDARVTFDQPVDGKSPKLVLYQNGLALPGERKNP